jgi:hypothetical protein
MIPKGKIPEIKLPAQTAIKFVKAVAAAIAVIT